MLKAPAPLNRVDVSFEVFYLLLGCFKRFKFLRVKPLLRDSQVFHQEEAPATKPDTLNSIPVTCMMEGGRDRWRKGQREGGTEGQREGGTEADGGKEGNLCSSPRPTTEQECDSRVKPQVSCSRNHHLPHKARSRL